MCLKVYKGIYRGAFALAVSYLEATEVTNSTHEDLRRIVSTYLNDNGVNVDFSKPPHRSIITIIVRAGWDTYKNQMTMDEALEYLSRRLEIPL